MLLKLFDYCVIAIVIRKEDMQVVLGLITVTTLMFLLCFIV